MEPFRGYSNGPGDGRGILTLLFLVLVIGAVIWVVMMLVHERDHRHAPPGTNAGPGRQSDAQRILDERFANGTIDIEDYKARRELLRHPPE